MGTLCLFVSDKPEPPVGQPAASTLTNKCITVSWYGPSYDGGSQVTHYQVEMSQPGLNTWTVLSANCKVRINTLNFLFGITVEPARKVTSDDRPPFFCKATFSKNDLF